MMFSWRVDPTILAGLLGAALLYVLCATRWRRRFDRSTRVTPRQGWCFGLALFIVWVILETPIDALADNSLFFVHMTQHLIMVFVVPVFLLAGLPGWMLAPLVRSDRLFAAARVVTKPLVATIVFNGIFTVAHVPIIYNVVASSELLHAGEHVLFMATATVMWWPILSPLPQLPRLSYPVQIGYLFLQTLPCAIIAALITLAGSALYLPYTVAPRILDITPLQDQEIGGLIMWIGGSTYLFCVMGAIFLLWASREDGESSASPVVADSRGI